MQITYSEIQTIPPQYDLIPADINPGCPPPTAFNDELEADGLITVMVDGPAGSAGLSKREIAFPYSEKTTFAWSYLINPSAEAQERSQAHETDWIIVGPDGTRYNGSCQWNRAEGGLWQIGNWTDTPIKSSLPSEQWTLCSGVFTIDWTAQNLIWQSIMGVPVPAAIATIPGWKNSGWQANLIVLQIQDCLNAKGGSYTRRMNHVNLICS